MIDFTTVRATIETYLDAEVTTVKVVFENTELENVDEEHITIEDNDFKSEWLEFGSDIRKVTSNLMISIFTKRGIGTQKARTIASEIVTLINALDSSIAFAEPVFNSDGAVEGAKLYKHVLVYPYSYVYGQTD